RGIAGLQPGVRPGARMAVVVGSRGIARMPEIVRSVVEILRGWGAEPFLFPAMGSHGGATPEGQAGVLAGYGITPEAMGAPLRSSLEVREVGISAEGVPVPASVEALDSDGILLVNRVKPHTDFTGRIGSGLLKMSVVGLGKREGATRMHEAASRLGHEAVIRGMAAVLRRETPLLGGLAVLENAAHGLARIEGVRAAEMEAREEALLAEARTLLPRLPLDDLDLLVVDRMGKNISGTGMDPAVIGRDVQGYSASLAAAGRATPFIRRLVVRRLTPETHGNAIGIGLADFTTAELVRSIDPRSTFVNSLTALTPQLAKVPIHAGSDREVLDLALTSAVLADRRRARIARIVDTLSLERLEVSEALWQELAGNPAVVREGALYEWPFDAAGNLVGDGDWTA
ncbi:MAG: hypothetical protein ACKO3N_14390, partial [Verrucomicrobiota bacterium]